MTEHPEQRDQQHPPREPEQPQVIDAEELFQGSREIWLEHAGARYRLRITRRNKLILQK